MRCQPVGEACDVATPPSAGLANSSGGRYFRFVRATCAGVFRLFFRLEFHGLGNIPSQGPFILAPNHQSYLDPFWVSIPFPYPLRYMTWDKFIYMPLIGHFIRTLGAFPVKLEKSDRTALRLSLEHLKQGGTLMIFPEGGRTRTGQVMPFKPGVIRLAHDAQVPIVPVSIVGGYQAYNPHHWLPRPRKVDIYFHPPMTLPRVTGKDELKQMLIEQTNRLQAAVESVLPSV
ncbi:MAG TPA: lysophospholipid acyltransferase family protein [Blastocatellia bacterium]|nr:lysophospholipid acyltransferase family protein [Blastocatellia bacterium]